MSTPRTGPGAFPKGDAAGGARPVRPEAEPEQVLRAVLSRRPAPVAAP